MSRNFFYRLLIVCLLPVYAFALSLPEKYPSYAYVFAEFDVDESYIYDSSFEAFVQNNEKKTVKFYKRSLERGDMLLPMVKNRLMDDGLSDLFIYISMVESGFTSDIVSPKKAVGIWQFMPATAKHYKLQVCNALDERCDPETSTKAAMAYLRKLHKQFGKWYIAVMAYNCGEGRMAKAIKKAGTDDLSILLNPYEKYLPRETRKYIKKILLTAMVGESEILDFQSKNDSIMQVEVKGGTKLSNIAALLGMKSSRLKKLNRQYKNGLIPKEHQVYTITIPEEKMMLFYMKYEMDAEGSDKKLKSIKPHFISHYVRLGDTLEVLAKKYNSSAEEIRLANKLQDDALTLDMFLLIPVDESTFDAMMEE